MQNGLRSRNSRKKDLLLTAVLCLVGVGINLLGSKAMLAANIPLYLDAIGTILTSSLGGYIPGIIVGLLTNAINGIADTTTFYYAVLNVMIAIAAAYFSEKGYYKKFKGILAALFTFVLIGGALGSLLTWFLYEHDFGSGISAPLAHQFFNNWIHNAFNAQLFADIVIDIADKALSLAIALALLAAVPKAWKDRQNLFGWRNQSARQMTVRGVPLGAKIMLCIATAALLISVAVTAISFNLFHNAALDNQTQIGFGLARLAASYLDGNKVEEYLTLGEAAEGYLDTEKKFKDIMDCSPDIAFIYAYQIREDGCHVVIDPDTENLEGEAPGTVIPFDEAFLPYLPKLLAGEEMDPVVSDDTYGHLLTLYVPVYDDNGVCQCYAAADLSMPRIIASEEVFMTRIISLFLGFFLLIMVCGIHLARHHIIHPINAITDAAGTFAFNTEDARAESLEKINQLDIHTGDEIENLYRAFEKTCEDTVGYISDSQKKNKSIAQLQNGMIMVLADVVESRDKMTGDHIRNTAAYARIIMEQMKADHVYEDRLTDSYMQDVVNSAPLHDVGKIHIADSVLNKPGKLTEEEYNEMKTHTVIGGEIIHNAIKTVSKGESGYLKEARNLANFHHERWDGKGYPQGLSGTDIPLSARIMAVADVFDALVSRRSYKEGFPFEKAMSIIREGAGTQFDPQIAQCFLNAEERVREVTRSKNEKAAEEEEKKA